jgi:hypothetical protein
MSGSGQSFHFGIFKVIFWIVVVANLIAPLFFLLLLLFSLSPPTDEWGGYKNLK